MTRQQTSSKNLQLLTSVLAATLWGTFLMWGTFIFAYESVDCPGLAPVSVPGVSGYAIPEYTSQVEVFASWNMTGQHVLYKRLYPTRQNSVRCKALDIWAGVNVTHESLIATYSLGKFFGGATLTYFTHKNYLSWDAKVSEYVLGYDINGKEDILVEHVGSFTDCYSSTGVDTHAVDIVSPKCGGTKYAMQLAMKLAAPTTVKRADMNITTIFLANNPVSPAPYQCTIGKTVQYKPNLWGDQVNMIIGAADPDGHDLEWWIETGLEDVLALRERQDTSTFYEAHVGLPKASSSSEAQALSDRTVNRFQGSTCYVGPCASLDAKTYYAYGQLFTAGTVQNKAFQPVDRFPGSPANSFDPVLGTVNNPEGRCISAPSWAIWTKATTLATLLDVLMDGKLADGERFATPQELQLATETYAGSLDTFYISYNQTFTRAGFQKNEPGFTFEFMEDDGFARTGAGENLVMGRPSAGVHFTLLTPRSSGVPEYHYLSQPTEALAANWLLLEPLV